MDCILLAAGYATRLYPLTENFPKPLLDVGGRTILDRLLDDLAGTGAIRRFVAVTNHKFAGHFRRWAETRPESVQVVDDGTSTNETRLGAARDIWLAVGEGGVDGDVLVMAGDNVLDFSLAGFLDFYRAKGTSCVMCHEEPDLAKRRKTAIVTLDGDGLVTSYEEKPAEPRGSLAVPPFYLYRAEDIRRIPEALADGCNPDAPGSFAAWLSRRAPVHAWRMPGRRHDIGDLASYEAARALFQ